MQRKWFVLTFFLSELHGQSYRLGGVSDHDNFAVLKAFNSLCIYRGHGTIWMLFEIKSVMRRGVRKRMYLWERGKSLFWKYDFTNNHFLDLCPFYSFTLYDESDIVLTSTKQLETDSKNITLAQRLAISKKSTIFTSSLWNLGKILASRGDHFPQVS